MALNERIKELIKQADTAATYKHIDFSVFLSDLIVKECANALIENRNPHWQQNYLAGWLSAAEFLKQHFGVEE